MKVKASAAHSCLTLQPPELAHPAPLSMGFSKQKYWSGLPCPSPGDLPDPGVKHSSYQFLSIQVMKHLHSAPQ